MDEQSGGPEERPAPVPLQWTPPPPFEAPIFSDQDARFVPPPVFHSSRRLAAISMGLLGVAGTLALLVAIHFLVGLDLLGKAQKGLLTLDEARAFDSLTAWFGWLQLGVSIVCGVAFLRWLWRSVGNAEQLGASYGIVDARGAVTAWLVPIRNLWKPYQVVIDLHDRLLAPLQSTSGRLLIRVWWACWLLGDVAGWLAMVSLRPVSISDQARLWAVLAASSALTVADAILAIAVVLQLQRLADARETARAGDPATAVSLVTRSQSALVTRLPFALAIASVLLIVVPLVPAYAGTSGYSAPASSGEWIEFTPSDGSFSVSLPSQPIEVKIPPKTSGSLTLSGDTFRAMANRELALVITYYDYPAGTVSTLSRSAAYDNMEASMPVGYTLTSSTEISIGSLSAREVIATSETSWIRARYVISGDRVFVIEADTTRSMSSAPEIDRFLDSFRLN